MFCSAFCYKASVDLCAQVPIDACWDRGEHFRLKPLSFKKTDEQRIAEMSLEEKLKKLSLSMANTAELDSDDDPDTDDEGEKHDGFSEDESSDDSVDSLEYIAQKEREKLGKIKAASNSCTKVIELPLSALPSRRESAVKEESSFMKLKMNASDWMRIHQVLKEWKTSKTLELFRYSNAEENLDSVAPVMVNSDGKQESVKHASMEDEEESNQDAEISLEVPVSFDEEVLQKREELLNEEQKVFEMKVRQFFTASFAGKSESRKVHFNEETEVKLEESNTVDDEIIERVTILPPVDSVDQQTVCCFPPNNIILFKSIYFIHRFARTLQLKNCRVRFFETSHFWFNTMKSAPRKKSCQ